MLNSGNSALSGLWALRSPTSQGRAFKSPFSTALRKAIMDEGSHPLHHRQVMARHRKEWAVLWKAIDELIKPQSTNNE